GTGSGRGRARLRAAPSACRRRWAESTQGRSGRDWRARYAGGGAGGAAQGPGKDDRTRNPVRALVTGSRGYIGSHLVDVLRDAGHEVTGCDLGLYAGCEWGELTPPTAELSKDVRDLTVEELEGHDVVMHLAAISNDPMGELDPSLTGEINARASIERARREHGPRRDGGAQPGVRVRAVEDRRRAGAGGARDGRLLARLPAQRDRLRRLPGAEGRPGREQPARLRARLRRGPRDERRRALAAADPLPRHRARLPRVRR